jgi:hypothetical protein
MYKTRVLLFAAVISLCVTAVFGQSTSVQPKLKRTIYKTDRFDFGVGGTVVITGAPNGSIRVEGWKNREIDISAEIEIRAEAEADLDRLAKVTTFLLEETPGRTGIVSVGTNDSKALKRIDKKFPKNLLAMPFKIDYVIKVPQYTDLQVDGGKGDLTITGVEGAVMVKFLETTATLDLVGGITQAVFGSGKVDVRVPSGWRGRAVDIQLAKGDMTVTLPAAINAEVDATILRTGKIDNGFTSFKPRVRKVEFTDKSIIAKAGVGGTTLKFTVGDGTLKISESGPTASSTK